MRWFKCESGEVEECRGCKVGAGWPHLLPLAPQLKALDLGCATLGELPPQLARLTGLTALSLGGSIAAGGWAALAPRLRRLFLCAAGTSDGCSSASSASASVSEGDALMAVVSTLTQLTFLHLGGNQMGPGGWGCLRALTRLAHLDASCCGLSTVPDALSTLTGLTMLSLYSNELRWGWEHLNPLTRLQRLDTEDAVLARMGPWPEGLWVWRTWLSEPIEEVWGSKAWRE